MPSRCSRPTCSPAGSGWARLFRPVPARDRRRGPGTGAPRPRAPVHAPGAGGEARDIALRWLRRECPRGPASSVEKSPWHLHELALIAEILPEARFVNVVRDGRDVAVSLIEARRSWSRVGDDDTGRSSTRRRARGRTAARSPPRRRPRSASDCWTSATSDCGPSPWTPVRPYTRIVGSSHRGGHQRRARPDRHRSRRTPERRRAADPRGAGRRMAGTVWDPRCAPVRADRRARRSWTRATSSTGAGGCASRCVRDSDRDVRGTLRRGSRVSSTICSSKRRSNHGRKPRHGLAR